MAERGKGENPLNWTNNMTSGAADVSAEMRPVSAAGSATRMAAASGMRMSDAHAQQMQAQHSALIALVLSKTQKIQKETKARKYRDIHGKVNEAVDSLTDFKDVVWPPPPVETPAPPDWMNDEEEDGDSDEEVIRGAMQLSSQGNVRRGSKAKELELRTQLAQNAAAVGDVSLGDGSEIVREAEGATAALSEATLQDETPVKDLRTVLEEEAEAADRGSKDDGFVVENERSRSEEAPRTNGTRAGPEAPGPAENREVVISPVDDDPQTREPMHPAVVSSLAAYCLVMTHPYKTPKICELALDSVTLLITNRYVSGRAGARNDATPQAASEAGYNGVADAPPPSLIHQLIESITKCSESSSEVVQGSMSKALLALMTSPKCGVHEASMLMAVRATFHVYLVSKSATAKEVSKATLIDMLKSVFNRMEAYDVMARSGQADAETGELSKHPLNGVAPPPQSTSAAGSHPVENGGSRTDAIKAAQNQQSAESFSAFASQFHTDGYLLFRALCKLSAKTLPGDDGTAQQAQTGGSKLLSQFTAAPVDPLALHSKILSLELILAVFEHCGDAFRTGEKFIYAVQHYLCVSLLKNCMSNHTSVAYLSLKIFLILVYKFKAHLKSEIEVFVANIFLRVLESPYSSFEQKALVLEALRALCSDPLMLTQIFLNYDCDFDAVNLYKSIVHNLTRLSGKSRLPTSSTKKDVSQDMEMSVAGLEVLVVILRAFLKALGLPGGDDDVGEEAWATSRIRGNLQLDVGMAVKAEDGGVGVNAAESGTGDDVSLSAKDIKAPVTKMDEGVGSASTADVAGKIVDVFDRKRTQQQNFETGCVKFTLSLKSGLLFFIENGFVGLDARQIALFLIEHKDKLDKTQIGEALGKEPESSFVKDEGIDPEVGGEGFFVRVLYHYVDAMDFTGLEFDGAIRFFLSGFRLPGEAQKIDRIMEKFAERYTRQNEDVFPSADTAFILAFSVIMLNTDLHNPNIKPEKRMTLESFIRNNRGISVDGGDLPEEFLVGIFNRIQSQPFTLKEDDDARAKADNKAPILDSSFLFDGQAFFGASAEERKREEFRKEREEMMAASEQLFKKRPGKKGSAERASLAAATQLTESVSPADVVKPMFDVTWGPLIGTLSQVLETSSDEDSIALCLNGFVYAVRISSHSGMSLARDTFVNSLAKFTTLGSIKEMKTKNIESIRTLLSIAIMDGEFLGESWGPVLQCISQLGRLQLFASGLDTDDKFLLKDNPQDDAGFEGGGFFRQPSKAEVDREMEENNGRAVLAAVNEVLIDKVFSSTVNLSARGIVHFIEQLVAVSATEIAGNSKKGITGVSSTSKFPLESTQTDPRSSGHGDDGPRIFSLQRLVEVADYNMDVRPRISWAQMWEIMANHFALIGCHENAMVSMFAIDALRQLSFKFLEKPELSDFNFQRLFLRPFLLIMENTGSREDIRELILRCVDNMVRSMSHNLRSGWKIFFSILTLSASDPSEKISTLGLAILQRLLDEHLDQLCRLADSEEFGVEKSTFSNGEPMQMTAMQRRQRNANAEDFVGLCRASLSFVQTEESDYPLPIGLSMRALCHTACYADLIADRRVLPPVSGSQSIDYLAFGYTYDGLPDVEAEEMVLWRPLLDGLAAGICSTAPSNSGGVGCLVQRGSVMTLRAILLRHGSLFSVSQWSAILRQVILPAIQIAAEFDESPVTGITSESPSVSSLDFLSEALPLPPHPQDEGLMKFALLAQSEESAPSRPLGPAELLVEASFADLRHGGDGNLSRAHGLAKKNLDGKNVNEQPFPDSWVATTAPIALGMLTDIAGEMIVDLGSDGRNMLWPIIMGQFQRWSIGYPLLKPFHERVKDQEAGGSESDDESEPWTPCEALVRIGCKELKRFPHTLLDAFPRLNVEDAAIWTKTLCLDFADTLSKNVLLEGVIHEELVKSKLIALGISSEKERLPTSDEGKSGESTKMVEKASGGGERSTNALTPYGNGRLVTKRTDRFTGSDGEETSVVINIRELDWGATLYGPPLKSEVVKGSSSQSAIRAEENELISPKTRYRKLLARENYLDRFIPALKVRCVAAHCLQQHLPSVMSALATLAGKEEISSLLNSLEESRIMSCKASLDEDLAHAFQEAMFSEWGDGVEEVEAALASLGGMNNRGGSKMFFLTQEAGANKAIIHLLALLYTRHINESNMDHPEAKWDKERFAEPLLLQRMMDVLGKFLSSEEKDGSLIDPNVWRMSSESGGKIALYCTSFATVVVSILKTILGFSPDQFQSHKKEIYPMLCSLVRVQSDEIRQLVHDILVRQVSPIVGVVMS